MHPSLLAILSHDFTAILSWSIAKKYGLDIALDLRGGLAGVILLSAGALLALKRGLGNRNDLATYYGGAMGVCLTMALYAGRMDFELFTTFLLFITVLTAVGVANSLDVLPPKPSPIRSTRAKVKQPVAETAAKATGTQSPRKPHPSSDVGKIPPNSFSSSLLFTSPILNNESSILLSAPSPRMLTPDDAATQSSPDSRIGSTRDGGNSRLVTFSVSRSTNRDSGSSSPDLDDRRAKRLPPFTGQAMVCACTSAVKAANGEVDALLFAVAAQQVIALMITLGRAFEFALPSLQHHVEIVVARAGELPPRATIAALADESLRNGAARAGKKAEAGSRSTVRLLWFMDFVRLLLGRLAADPLIDLRSAAGDAYEASFGATHSWMVKAGVRQGLRILPSRKSWEDKNLFPGEAAVLSPRERAARLREWCAALDELAKETWLVVDSRGLRDVP